MPEILHELVIHASPEKVYDALTTEKGLAGWWTTDVSAKPVSGSVAEFGFNKHQFVIRMRIDQLEPPAQVKWSCLGDHPEWKGTTVTFRLKKDGDQTGVRLHHTGWKTADGILGMCRDGWANHLASLKALLETGEGAPNTE